MGIFACSIVHRNNVSTPTPRCSVTTAPIPLDIFLACRRDFGIVILLSVDIQMGSARQRPRT
jgi:hypothetical protein